MYYPCLTCFAKFGKLYTSECDNDCDYARAVKELEYLKEKIALAIKNESK